MSVGVYKFYLSEENKSRSPHNVEGSFLYRYNDNFTLVRDFACCVITGNK